MDFTRIAVTDEGRRCLLASGEIASWTIVALAGYGLDRAPGSLGLVTGLDPWVLS
jgi:hypothetical protein